MEATVERHVLAVMSDKGDLKTLWDPNNEEEVAIARKAFDDARAKRMVVYRTDRDGERSEVMHKFDPSARSMIARPAIVGG